MLANSGLFVRNSSREWIKGRVISLARAIAQVKVYTVHNHVDFGSNIKNYLAMGLAHDKKQSILLKAL